MNEIKLPSLGEGIEKGTVISIMVKVGDTITAEQSLMEVETDKVVVEVPSDTDGVVTAILISMGDEVAEGTPIIQLDSSENNVTQASSEAKIEEEAPVTEVVEEAPDNPDVEHVVGMPATDEMALREVKLPSLGEGIEKGKIISIMISEGDTIAKEQSLMEVETDKVVVEVPSDTDGEVTKILVKLGDEINEGTPIISVKEAGSNTVEEIKDEVKVSISPAKEEKKQAIVVDDIQPTSAGPSSRKGFRASPLAKKIAREIGIDLNTMPISNPSKRISVKDVKDYAKHLNQNRASGTSMNATQMPLPDFTKWGAVRKDTMSGIMQATSKNMTTSWSQIPHAWLQEKVDITYLEEKRQTHKHAFKAKGGSLTITGILVKVVAKALEEFPIFNASIDSQNNTIVYKEYINIGVAVDTDRGLLVPVLKNTDKKSISDIAMELPSLANKVKQKKITAEELDGATFTISNLGGIGTSAIFPLVTFPQVAILGVAASQTEAVWINGQFQPRLLMPLTIGFDHRVINGADAARFLQQVKSLMEDWFQWSVE